MILSKCLPEGCGVWCWLHDRLPCKFRLLCFLADRHHYGAILKWRDYR